jgi:CYTH domain-containing protein
MATEIERKFLVGSVPDVWPVPYEDFVIVQAYLVPLDPAVTSERVRSRTRLPDGDPVYTHTKKVRLGDGVHEEDERNVDIERYVKLLCRRDVTMQTISKMRRVFDWAGRTFELDYFDPPLVGLGILEVELPAMDAPVELPPFVAVVREVTTERDYTNAAIARSGVRT